VKSKFLAFNLSIFLGLSGSVFADERTAQEHYEEALRKDAETVAESHKIPVEDALRRLRLQAAARNGIVAQLRKEFKYRMAGIYIDHEIEDRLVVRLKGQEKVDDRILDVDDYVLRVVFIVDQKHSVDETEAILEKNHEELLREFENLQATFVDEVTGDIVLVIYLEKSNDVIIDELKNIGENILKHPVKIKNVSSKMKDLTSVRGGGRILPGCTTGFAVKENNGSRKGVLTAGHCSDGNQFYYNWDLSKAFLQQQQKVDSLTEDVKWCTPFLTSVFPATIEPEFYGNSATVPTVLTGKVQQSDLNIGDTVCHHGVTTGYSCGKVVSKKLGLSSCADESCKTWIGVYPSENVNPSLACSGGDSGGPVFIASQAVGLHKGGISDGPWLGGCEMAVFMSIDRINVLGVKLLYGP